MIRDSISEQVGRFLSERILRGDYKPGERLIELKIARELGVSQGPVREALRKLEAGGLVEVEPFRGTRVRQPTRRDLLDAFEVRGVLEQLAAEISAPHFKDNVVVLRHQLIAIQKAIASGSFDQYTDADLPFHRYIVELSGNSILLKFWDALQFEIRTRVLLTRGKVDLNESNRFHEQIVDALNEGDGKRAGELLREHIASFSALLRDETDVHLSTGR